MTDSPTLLGSLGDFCYTSFALNNNVPGPRDVQRIEQELQNFDLIVRFFERHRMACRAVLSPIRRIPLEVLGEVFTFSVCPNGFVSKSGRRQLLSICLVSKGWREAAYGTHRLWTELGLERPFTEEVRLKAQRWLTRAGSLPKSVSIRAADIRLGMCIRGNPHCSFMNRSIARFLTDGPAISDLTIECASSSCIRHLLEEMGNVKRLGLRRSWDSVKTLRMVVDSEWLEEVDDDDNGQSDSMRDGGDSEGRRTTSLFAHLPAITSLYLHLPEYEGDDTDLALDIPEKLLARLKDFTLICDWGADKILPVLKSCSNLETFTLDANNADFILDPDNPWHTRKDEQATLLPKVRKLCLWRVPPDAAAYLQFFRAYSLEEMELRFNLEGIRWNSTWGIAFSSYFERFIQRSKGKGSSTSLRHLHLSSLEITAKEMHRILSKLPSLTHLTLDQVRVPSTLFRDLLWVKKGTAPLPNLEELTLSQSLNNLDIDVAHEYVRAREKLSREDGSPFARTNLTVDHPTRTTNGQGISSPTLSGESDESSE